MSARVDILVVGAGAAGIAAAVSAARSGCATLLLDRNSTPGGTGGHSGLTTLCGLYDSAGRALNTGFASEFSDAIKETLPLRMGKVWALPYRPQRFREAAHSYLRDIPSVTVVVEKVAVENDRVVSVNGFEVGAVIDCSGDAVVAQAAQVECLATDETTQASAVIFPLRGVTRDLHSLAAVAQVLLPLARAGFPALSFQPSLEAQTVVVKFTGTRAQAPALIEFLRTQIDGFQKCVIPENEIHVARRAGRMIVGEYILTGADVLAGCKFEDAVARGAWPIEQWGTDGVARLKYLAPGEHYEIPARCLQARTVKNLFMAGKTISADVDAIASARVMGCCLATGEAAGQLAARWLASGCP